MSNKMDKETITFTFGDSGENHVGMQIIGKKAKEGFSYDDIIKSKENFDKDYKTELYKLSDLIEQDVTDAYVLVIRNFINEEDSKKLYEEHTSYDWDAKYYCKRRKKVLNKHARRNVMFSDEKQEPDYENGKGTIIAWKDIPVLYSVRERLEKRVGDKAKNMICEGNRYYDISKTGIGWHGDTERRKVIGVRIGATIPLKFKWFHRSKSCGDILEIDLNNGDAYIMSEKACGFDWRKSSIYTLRHCAGSEKYTKLTK